MRQVTLVLSDLRSLYNVGSFFRTADAAGIERIICCGTTGTPDNHRLWKVSLGSEKTVDWLYFEDTISTIDSLKNQGYEIIGAELTDTSKQYNETNYSDKVALVLGSETEGLSHEILKKCTQVVHLPMRGEKESLTVAVAGGVLIYYLLS